MSIDPLAMEYVYNSPYAFQENKIGLGRELEGLEMVSERSKDGKSVTLTMKVNPVNKSININNDQFKTILAARIKTTESALSGSIGKGVTVNAKVVVDPKATLIMEFNDAINPDKVKTFGKSNSPEKVQNAVDSALGVVSEIGNTQVNTMQVNVPRNLNFDDAGMPIIDAENLNYISNTGTHEDLHGAGLDHVDDPQNRMNYENTGGTQLTEEQRKLIIDNVESQQPQ